MTNERGGGIPKHHVKNKMSYDSFKHRSARGDQNTNNDGGATTAQIQTAENLNLMNNGVTSPENNERNNANDIPSNLTVLNENRTANIQSSAMSFDSTK